MRPTNDAVPELSVVIPARNEALLLPHQLDALSSQTSKRKWEVLVVDNGSTDGTADVARRYATRVPGLRIVREDEPGIGHAREAGVRASAAPSIAFCDADDVVCSTWVDAMIAAAQAYEIATGPLDGDSLNRSALRGMRGSAHQFEAPTFFGIFPYPHGGNFVIHREALRRLGGFDSRYAGGEDVEFGLRAWQAGIEIGFAPSAVIAYRYSTRPSQLWRQGYQYGRVRPRIRDALIRQGLPAPSAFAGWRSWLLLVARLPTVVTSTGRSSVAWIAGNRIGQLAGSLATRRLFL